MNKQMEYPGSKWWKFDFHTHTPKSNDYGHGDDSLKNIQPEEWLRKAMEAGLDCVVVTDHNSGGWIDELQAKNNEIKGIDEKPEWHYNLTIFPGVEITVADSSSRIHLLAIFDPSCNGETITSVLGGCGITAGFGDDQNTSTSKGFIDVVKIIKDANGIAVPAHIDSSKGLLENSTSLTPELEKSLNSVFAAEFCDLNKFNNAEPLLGKAVGRLAKIAGSDAHKPEEIGRHFSWLKMSKPSIEGLKLSLSDYDFCVKNQEEDPNFLPDIYLTKLKINSMQHCGRNNENPFFMSFHPHFNSIIGGRGAGKSTVIESARIVTRRDQTLASEAPEIKKQLDKFMNLSQNKGVMLNETEILMEISRRSKRYQLRWRYDGEGSVLEEENESIWKETETGNLEERFPLSIYSQKQINELASNPRGLLDVIDRSPEVDRTKWQASWERQKSQFLQLREKYRELLRQLSGEQQIRVRLKDVESDLKQYEDKGHGEILKQYQKRSQQKNSLPTERVFDELASAIREIAMDAELPDFPEHLFDEKEDIYKEIKLIHKDSSKELKVISNSLEALAKSVDLLKTRRNERIASSKWFESVQASITNYNNLLKEYEEKKNPLNISVYGDWVQQRNQLQKELSTLNSVRKDAEMVEKKITEALGELLKLRLGLLENRRNFLQEVIGDSSFVKMELVSFGDVSSLEEEYRNLLNLGDGKYLSSVCDRESKKGILWELFNWEKSNTSESDLSDIITNIKSVTFDIAQGKATGNHGAFDNKLKGVFESQPAVFDQLDAWWPEDLLQVKYSKDSSSGKFDDLEKGSAGQKAAAILAFLLSYGDEPLIIDQPEDDLDNALIYDLIVKQIHENKNRRQLIIVTHNPNIVVNGDSELVHVLKFKNGQIQKEEQGGLEEINVREAICNIMEGGRKAFDQRYKRITLEV